MTTVYANELRTSKTINPLTSAPGTINYGEKDGLKWNLYNGYLDSKNRIWWGHMSEDGLTMLDLNNFAKEEKTVVTELNDVTINGNYIDYRNLSKDFVKKIRLREVEPFYN